MDIQSLMEAAIGDKELPKLQPKIVHIKETRIETVGDKKKLQKVICQVLHPDSDDLIEISSVKYDGGKDKLKTSGLWVTLQKKEDDKEPDKIQKGSPLAVFMEKLHAETVRDLQGEACETAEDDKGYLCFKVY